MPGAPSSNLRLRRRVALVAGAGAAGVLLLFGWQAVRERPRLAPIERSAATAPPLNEPPPSAGSLATERTTSFENGVTSAGDVAATETVALVVTRRFRVCALGDREPIAGAVVEWWRPGEEAPASFGASDEGGRVELSGPLATAAFVRVRADRFALLERDLAIVVAPPDEQELLLRDGGVLAGRIVRRGGAPWSGGLVRVAAWPGSEATWGDVDVGPASRRDHCHVVACDASGAFRMEGLPVGVTFRLAAAGAGLCRCSVEDDFVVPDESIVLEAAPLFGAFVEFVDAEGGPLRCSPKLPIAIDLWSDEPVAGATILDHHPATREAALAGVPESLLRQLDPQHLLRLLCIDSDAEVGATSRFHASPPGYVTRRVEAPLHRLDGPIDAIRVPFERRVDGFGAVEVSFVGAGVEGGRVVPGRLFLRSRDSMSCSLELPVTARADRPFQIDGLPHGLYDSGFATPGWQAEPLPRPFTIGPRVAELTVETRPSATVRVVVPDVGGLAYRSSLHLYFWSDHGGTRAASVTSRDGPPYVVGGLRAKRCDIEVRLACPLRPGGSTRLIVRDVDLVEGAEVVVDLSAGVPVD